MEKKFLEIELDEDKSIKKNYNLNPEFYQEELNNLSVSDEVYILYIFINTILQSESINPNDIQIRHTRLQTLRKTQTKENKTILPQDIQSDYLQEYNNNTIKQPAELVDEELRNSLKKTSKYLEANRAVNELRKDEDEMFDGSTITSESSYLDPYKLIYLLFTDFIYFYLQKFTQFRI